MAVQRELTARLLTGFFQKELVLLRAMALVFADRQNKESRAEQSSVDPRNMKDPDDAFIRAVEPNHQVI